METRKRTYWVANAVLATSLALPELGETEATTPDWTLEPLSGERKREWDFQDTWEYSDGSVWMGLAREADRHWLCFPGLATFCIHFGARTIEVGVDHDVTHETWRHLFLDQVLPMIFNQQGSLVLHAAAVAVESGAVGLVAPSGTGKSTLAASFEQAGYPTLSDDFLRAEFRDQGCWVWPSYAGHRLWPDSLAQLGGGQVGSPVAQYTLKQRLPGSRAWARRSRPLRALAILSSQPSPQVQITPLSALDAFLPLSQCCIALERTGKWAAQQLCHKVTQLQRTVPVFELAYPRDYARLTEVHQALLEHVRSGSRDGTGHAP